MQNQGNIFYYFVLLQFCQYCGISHLKVWSQWSKWQILRPFFPAPTAIFQYFYGFDFLIEVQEHSRCGWILTILVLLKRFQMNGETNKHFTYGLDVSKLHLATLSNNRDVAKSRLPDNFTGWKTKTWSNVEGVTKSHKTRVKCPKLFKHVYLKRWVDQKSLELQSNKYK